MSQSVKLHESYFSWKTPKNNCLYETKIRFQVLNQRLGNDCNVVYMSVKEREAEFISSADVLMC